MAEDTAVSFVGLPPYYTHPEHRDRSDEVPSRSDAHILALAVTSSAHASYVRVIVYRESSPGSLEERKVAGQ